MKQIGWWGLTAMWMGVVWWLSDQPNLSSGLEADWWLRKGAHLAEYAVLVWLWWQALGNRRLAWAVFAAVVYAVGDEWHQSFVAGRHGSPVDVLIDSAGVAAGAGLVWLFARLRRGRATL